MHMLNIFRKLLGNTNEGELKKIRPIVDRINALEPEMQKLTDEEMRAKTAEYKRRVQGGESLDDILPEAFALVREGAVRALGQRPFDVQLIGGIVLHQGRIAEMRTGEGKTLTAALPAYLNALSGQGVHVVTVNEYLAKFQSEWMGQVYRFLGMSVGLVVHGMETADKQAAYFRLDPEENPALGYRAIRICLTRKEVFKQQLRAILRASAYGTVSIMFPMIISVREVRDAKELLEECRRELVEQGYAVVQVEVGIMIETPAAVMIADELAEEVEFFSLGTNDLTQYTLAIDRQNPKLDNFYDPHHPAILRMIRQTVEAGHRHGCWVGICGELGADQTLTETFLRMGLDELSVSPSAVLPLRKKIRSLDLSKEPEA